jgi:hypothetical protein
MPGVGDTTENLIYTSSNWVDHVEDDIIPAERVDTMERQKVGKPAGEGDGKVGEPEVSKKASLQRPGEVKEWLRQVCGNRGRAQETASAKALRLEEQQGGLWDQTRMSSGR